MSSDSDSLVVPGLIYPEGLAFFLLFLEGHGAFVCEPECGQGLIRCPALITHLNRRFGGLRVSRLQSSESGLHVADVTEAPAARDVDGAAPLVTSLAEGRWAATSAGNHHGNPKPAL